jgi:aminoglycoside phosphotransferase (APT) family kinase protein
MTATNPPWTAEVRIDLETATRVIGRQFPELHPLEIEIKGEGWDNVVLQINHEYLFRFPRRKLAVELLENEGLVLPKIRNRLPLSIPELIFRGQPDNEFPWPFLGYRHLEGTTACRAHLSEQERIEMAPTLATFLSTLHKISEQEAIELGAVPDRLGRLDVIKRIPQMADYLSKLKDLNLFPDLDSLHAIMEQSKSCVDTGSKTLVHGDLYVRHLLIGSNRTLTGIIDWGDVHFGNPAVDLSVIFTVLPPHAHKLFFDVYGEISNETWLLARFRSLVSGFVTTVYAHSIGDTDLLQEGLIGLRHLSQHVQRQYQT